MTSSLRFASLRLGEQLVAVTSIPFTDPIQTTQPQVLVPTLWVFYGLVLIFCTNYDRDCIILFQLSLPMFSYLGIMATESGMADFKDLRPHVMKVFPGTRARLLALPRKRRQLARDFKKFVSKNGPSMGALYFNKSVDWMSVEQNMKKKE